MTTPSNPALADVLTRPDYLAMSREEKVAFLENLIGAAEWESVRLEDVNATRVNEGFAVFCYIVGIVILAKLLSDNCWGFMAIAIIMAIALVAATDRRR